jgi:hypothetical protein
MKKVAVALAVLAAILLLAGCATTTSGGGWMASASDPNGKATLGLTVNCDLVRHKASGEVQYNDHVDWNGMTVQFHASKELPASWEVDDSTGEAKCFAVLDYGCTDLAYRPQPKGGPGTLHLCVYDGELTGRDKGDWVSVDLKGGMFDTYHNEGLLEGGNITTNWD